MSEFIDKVIFITGAAGSIGSSTVDLFLSQGAKVICTDFSYERLNSKDIDFSSMQVKIGLDVSDYDAVNEIIDLTVEKCGRLDVVVNSAGVLNIKPILELTEEDWDRTLAVNLKGTFFVCQSALKHMIKREKGCLVNIASISGKVGGVLAGADYSASKAAVICLTKSLAKAGAPFGIRSNSIAPSAVKSPMLDLYYEDYASDMAVAEVAHPMKRFGEAVEVAQAILFLASSKASYINGTCLDVNGGALME